jgi:hypothetical protein
MEVRNLHSCGGVNFVSGENCSELICGDLVCHAVLGAIKTSIMWLCVFP